MEAKKIFYDYLMQFCLTPYRWGGDDFSGIDCSGLLVEFLQACGQIPAKSDYNAQALYEKFRVFPGRPRDFGTILFWGKDLKSITHVTIALNKDYMLGAEGGGSATTDLAAAVSSNAFVKVRPISYRGVPVAEAHPQYCWE